MIPLGLLRRDAAGPAVATERPIHTSPQAPPPHQLLSTHLWVLVHFKLVLLHACHHRLHRLHQMLSLSCRALCRSIGRFRRRRSQLSPQRRLALTLCMGWRVRTEMATTGSTRWVYVQINLLQPSPAALMPAAASPAAAAAAAGGRVAAAAALLAAF